MDYCTDPHCERQAEAHLAHGRSEIARLRAEVEACERRRLREYRRADAAEARLAEVTKAATALLAVCDCVGDEEDPKYGVPKRALREALAPKG